MGIARRKAGEHDLSVEVEFEVEFLALRAGREVARLCGRTKGGPERGYVTPGRNGRSRAVAGVARSSGGW
jgi:hypothetical protein